MPDEIKLILSNSTKNELLFIIQTHATSDRFLLEPAVVKEFDMLISHLPGIVKVEKNTDETTNEIFYKTISEKDIEDGLIIVDIKE